jgi:hypothetical protein
MLAVRAEQGAGQPVGTLVERKRRSLTRVAAGQRPAGVRGGWQVPQRVIGAPTRAVAQRSSARRSAEHTFTQSPTHVLPRAGLPVIVWQSARRSRESFGLWFRWMLIT